MIIINGINVPLEDLICEQKEIEDVEYEDITDSISNDKTEDKEINDELPTTLI